MKNRAHRNHFSFVQILLLLSTMPVFEAWTTKWLEMNPSTKIEPPRSGHSSWILNKDVYVFGGYAEEKEFNGAVHRYATNDLWRWDHLQDNWVLEQAADLWKMDDDPKSSIMKVPQQRLAAAAACTGDVAYVFGGWDPQEPGTGGVILQDVAKYGCVEGTWARLQDECKSLVLENPTSRLVSVTISNSRILLHNHRCVDHVMILDPANPENGIISQPTTGDAPSPRGLHAACTLPDTQHVLFFGGAAQDGTMSNQVFALDVGTWAWKELQTAENTKAPSPRASPCLCALDNRSAIVFGGASTKEAGGLHGNNDLWLLQADISKGTVAWKLLEDEGAPQSPPGRNAATLSPIPSPKTRVKDGGEDASRYFLLSGGWYPFQTTHGDTFVLRVSPSNEGTSAK